QVVGLAVRYRRRGVNGARHDDHPERAERAARDAGPDVRDPVDDGGQGLDVLNAIVGLLDDGALRRLAQYEVRLDAGLLGEELQEADAVDDAGGARHADDEPVHAFESTRSRTPASAPSPGARPPGPGARWVESARRPIPAGPPASTTGSHRRA